MSDPQKIFEQVMEHARDTGKLEGALALLEWDEHTYIPPAGGAYRAEQVGLLSGLIHQRRTAPQLGDWLKQLADSPLAAQRHEPVGAAIAGWVRDFEKHVKLPQRLVEEMAKRPAWANKPGSHHARPTAGKTFSPICKPSSA